LLSVGDVANGSSRPTKLIYCLPTSSTSCGFVTHFADGKLFRSGLHTRCCSRTCREWRKRFR